jgi:hypothetical protein
MMDLRAVQLNGQPLTAFNTAKEVTVAVGDTITLDLFAIVSGTNGLNDEQVALAHGSVLSVGALLGNLSGGPVAPFTGLGSQSGSVQDIDGDGDLDIGVAPNGGTPVIGYFVARTNAPVSGTPISANASEVRVGSFNFTMTGGNPEAFINFVRRANASGGNITTAGVWFEDEVPKNPTVSPLTVGTPVHAVVPEPASVATTAAGLASLGLLARRRNKLRA